MTLINTTPLEFTKLSDDYREYDFVQDGYLFTIFIAFPRYLNVNPVHGAHRIVDAEGTVHYIPNKWVALRWRVAEGTPHFHTTVAQPDGQNKQTTFSDRPNLGE